MPCSTRGDDSAGCCAATGRQTAIRNRNVAALQKIFLSFDMRMIDSGWPRCGVCPRTSAVSTGLPVIFYFTRALPCRALTYRRYTAAMDGTTSVVRRESGCRKIVADFVERLPAGVSRLGRTDLYLRWCLQPLGNLLQQFGGCLTGFGSREMASDFHDG